MNKIIGIVASLAVTAALAGCGAAAATSAGSGSSGVQVARVTASNYKWSIDKNTFKAGAPIEFNIQGQDGAHGFSIDGTDVSQMVAPGTTQKVTWTPLKPGTYIIRCNVMCGSGHGDMTATITIQS